LKPKIKDNQIENWKYHILKINIELAKHGLQQVQNFEYKVGDCLFDSIEYLLNYSISLK